MNLENNMRSIEEIIEKHGYAVIGVMSSPSVLYTVGLTDILGYEMVAVTRGSIQTLTGLMNIAIDELKKNPDHQLIKHAAASLSDGSDVRVKIEVISNENILEYIAKRTCDVKVVVQFFIADKNNILPGESGYDYDGWPQSI